MLTRRHIRIKAMQSIYSISHNGNQSLDNQLNFFTDSVQKCFDLYYLLMSVFNKVFNLAIEKTVLEKKLNHKLNDSIGHLITNNPYFEFLSGNKIISNYIEIRKNRKSIYTISRKLPWNRWEVYWFKQFWSYSWSYRKIYELSLSQSK